MRAAGLRDRGSAAAEALVTIRSPMSLDVLHGLLGESGFDLRIVGILQQPRLLEERRVGIDCVFRWHDVAVKHRNLLLDRIFNHPPRETVLLGPDIDCPLWI